MSEAQVFDYESAVEGAVRSILEPEGFFVLTSSDAVDLQSPRPRVEVTFTLGQGLLRWVPRNLLPPELANSKVESAWKGTLETRAIAGSDEAGKSVMAAFRAKLRRIYASLTYRVNQTELENFSIQISRQAGTARSFHPQEGYEVLTMLHDLDFSVQATTWAKLNT